MGVLRSLEQVLCAGLLHKRPTKQKLNPQSVRIGGKDQAWIYREEMRDY